MRQIVETGRGVALSCVPSIGMIRKITALKSREIPYTTTSEVIIDKIVELIKAGKVREISDLRDETDKTDSNCSLT